MSVDHVFRETTYLLIGRLVQLLLYFTWNLVGNVVSPVVRIRSFSPVPSIYATTSIILSLLIKIWKELLDLRKERDRHLEVVLLL